MPRHFIILIFFYFFGSAFFAPNAFGQNLSPERLIEEIKARRSRVAEFRMIHESAKKNGLHAFLMGGLASSFAHYVAMDLRREDGDRRYLDSRFKYFWDQIYADSQDIDLAVTSVDSSKPGNLTAFIADVERLVPHTKVDIHGLKKGEFSIQRSSLDSADFLNQHSDSISNGLISLSTDEVKDLRGYESEIPNFIYDLAHESIRFYYSDKHKELERYKVGMNPPLLAIIRYFINVNRYHLTIPVIERPFLKLLISEMKLEHPTSYVLSWLEKNGKKLVTQAFDIEDALRTIQEDFELSALIASVPGLSIQPKSTRWLVTRKPALSLPNNATPEETIGKKTAADFKLGIFSHGTNFASWRQVQWNPFGIPNFIRSINDCGQAAALGEGVYALEGSVGACGDHHIRLRLDSDAIEGRDFEYFPENKTIVVKNRNKMRFILEDSDSMSEIFSWHVEKFNQKTDQFQTNFWMRRWRNLSIQEKDILSILEMAKKFFDQGKYEEIFDSFSRISAADIEKIKKYLEAELQVLIQKSLSNRESRLKYKLRQDLFLKGFDQANFWLVSFFYLKFIYVFLFKHLIFYTESSIPWIYDAPIHWGIVWVLGALGLRIKKIRKNNLPSFELLNRLVKNKEKPEKLDLPSTWSHQTRAALSDCVEGLKKFPYL